MNREIEIKEANNFELDNHFFSKALNSQIHPTVSHFFNLDNEKLINRYSLGSVDFKSSNPYLTIVWNDRA